MEKSKFLKLLPMLLDENYKPFNDNNYIYEIKFDGIRALIFIDNGNIIIKSRNSVILNDVYPELKDIKNISKSTCIFDGEIVLYDNDKISFRKLLERFRIKNKHKILLMKNKYPVTFICFDILYKDKDLTNFSLIERKNILNKFKDTKYFVKSRCFEDGIKLFELIKKNNMEGIVAKKKSSIYLYGKRSKDWKKIKNYIVEEFYICGYDKHKNSNIISVILGEKKDNKVYYVGKVTMGSKHELYSLIIASKEINNYLLNYKNKSIFIINKYKILVNYIERTSDNLLREPFIKK